jgi:hypothetical protein
MLDLRLGAGFGALLLLGACGSPAQPPAAKATRAASSSPAAGGNRPCTGSDVGASLVAAARAQNAASSYRIEGATTSAGTSLTYTMEIVKPDRFHITTGSGEFIAIGTTTWRKSGGTWKAAPGLDIGALIKSSGQLSDQIINKATFTAVSVDPNATAAGQPVVHYSFHQSIPSDSEADSQMWLARDTCRPVQAASTWTTTAAGGSSRGESTINWSKWDAVSIEAPA